MKFWELISVFRSEEDNLIKVFERDNWSKYRNQYNNFDNLVINQDRTILDEVIPFDLAKEVCEISKMKFYLFYKENPNRLRTWVRETDEEYEVVTPLDILLRFGGKFIEETLEYGSSYVIPKVLGKNIEVLGTFNLTQIGMLSILRTENGKLNDNQIITSLDNSREWIIVNEPVMFLKPMSASIKRNQQIEQGIVQYIIKPIKGNEKPIDKEILKLKEEY